jgi:glycosyltransferase involved in cell wall biosynthesis
VIKVVILTDHYRFSYKVIGSLYEKSLRDSNDFIVLETPVSYIERKRLASKFPDHIFLHNTLGHGFVPIPESYNIALPLHEWSEYPKNWIKLLNQFDEVWTTTDHVFEVLQRGGLNVPIFKLPPALDSENIPEKQNWILSEKPKFYFVGEPHFRKGHHLLMQGFMRAFSETGRALLTIKTSPSCEWESPRDDIVLIKEKWSREKLLAEYAQNDCFVSASLAEGLGLPIAEAVMSGLPVCTNFWGGHKSLLTRGGFVEIEHEEIIQPFTSDPAFYAEGQKCAYSSPAKVADAFLHFIQTTESDRKQIANIAKQQLLENYSSEIAQENISKRLKEINSTNA